MQHTFFKSIVLCATLFSSTTWAVVNGEAFLPTQPIVSALVNIKLKNGMCSGTVIAPNVILTAAHCRDIYGEPQIVAQINAERKSQACQIATVEEYAYVPGAIPELPRRVHAPDLLLLRISRPLCGAIPATLLAEPLALGNVVNGAGYGRGSPKFGEPRWFPMQIIDTKQARESVYPIDEESEQMLTVGPRTLSFALAVKPGASFCYSDSGGPVFIEAGNQAFVLGVNSSVLFHETLGGACEKSYLQLVASLAPYKAWIEDKIKEWAPPK